MPTRYGSPESSMCTAPQRQDPSSASLMRERLRGSSGCQLPKPAQPFAPRHGSVRRRGRREHEKPRVGEPALLHPELRPLPERAAVRLLADERDPAGLQLARDPLEMRAVEVALAEIA